MIAFVVAHDENYVIGYDNQLPWYIPEDLAYFKEVTMGKPMIMGRNTFESIGRPLPGRTNIVVTRNVHYHDEGILICHSMEQAIALARSIHNDVMIIGGAEIFKEHLHLADTLYITEVHGEFKGDTFFPRYDEWVLEWSSPKHQSKTGIYYTYKRFIRKVSE